MSLHIVLGYRSRSPQAEPVVVYAGRSGSAAREALASRTDVLRFEVFDNPSGYRKNNPRYQAPAAPAVPPGVAAARKRTT